MALFGGHRQKGITEHELTAHHNRLLNRLHGSFHGSRATRKRKQQILDVALSMSSDKDYGAARNQKGVITPDEFDTIVDSYTKEGVFRESEAKELRDAARDALDD